MGRIFRAAVEAEDDGAAGMERGLARYLVTRESGQSVGKGCVGGRKADNYVLLVVAVGHGW